MSKHIILVLILSGTIAFLGCNPAEEQAVTTVKLRSVRTQEIVSRDLPVKVQAVGRLVPNRQVDVSTQVAGIVQIYTPDVGDKIKKGGSLLKLDPTDYRLALNEAKAALKSANARLAVAQGSFERSKQLFPEKAITAELYDKSEAEYLSAKASVTQLKVNLDIKQRQLDKTVIGAPFDAYVTRRFVEIGQNIRIGEAVMSLADMKTMRVRIHLNEQDYVHLDKRDPVSVKVEAFPQTPFAGRVDKIGITADPRTNTFEVEILVENPDFALKAGLTARVTIQTDVIRDAIMVPQNTVMYREDRKEVFVIENEDTAVTREVSLGRAEGALVRIMQGLAPGEQLVTTGSAYLKSGDKVLIAP